MPDCAIVMVAALNAWSLHELFEMRPGFSISPLSRSRMTLNKDARRRMRPSSIRVKRATKTVETPGISPCSGTIM